MYDIKTESNHNFFANDILVHNCGEAILRDTGGVCNLTEVMIRPDDSLKDIENKIEMATIMGTFQATLTNFRYLRKIWKNNAEEEALLGVSLTGIMDNKFFSNMASKKEFKEWSTDYDNLNDILNYLRKYIKKINKEYSEKLGINKAGQTTLIKPSGTVSILTGTSSGIHPRYSKFFIRRVRQDLKDPLTKLMINEGIPYVEENDKVIFSFYIKSPKHSVLQKDMNALSQLELWKIYKENWCDGNPSQTVYYTDDEFFSVADWIWLNWDLIGGLSFFPKDDHIYDNAPLEEITKEEYELQIKTFPDINWDKLPDYEITDNTTSSQILACSGDSCEIL